MRFIALYKFFPPEAFAVERLLWTIWTSAEEFHPRFATPGSWQADIPRERVFRLQQTALKKVGRRLASLGSLLEDRSEMAKLSMRSPS